MRCVEGFRDVSSIRLFCVLSQRVSWSWRVGQLSFGEYWPLEKSVPMRFAGGGHRRMPHGQCIVHGATELRVFHVHSGAILRRLEWRWGCCELRLRSFPRYQLLCYWFQPPAVAPKTWPGTIQVSRSTVAALYYYYRNQRLCCVCVPLPLCH